MSDKHLSGLMNNSQKDNEEEEEEEQWQDNSPQKMTPNPSKNKQQFEEYQPLPGNINPMGKVKMNNIKNMSINIFNQFQSPPQAEDLIPSLGKLNLNNKKDLAFNYYFGERQGGSKAEPQPMPQQSKFYDMPQPSKTPFVKEDFMAQQKKLQKPMQPQPQSIFKNDMMNPQAKGMMMNPLLADNPDMRRKNMMNSIPSNLNRDANANPNQNHPNMSQLQFMPKQPQLDDQGFMPSYMKSNQCNGRFFVIKSIDEDNIVKSINFKIWCSTIKGNQKLQKAFKEADKKYPIYLFFSVNGSGKFMGLAQMVSDVEYRVNFNYWSQNDKWKGFFFINWLYIKDIPNKVFRTILNEFNDNKPVTSSRDTQEIFPPAGFEMLKIFKEYPQESLFLDDMPSEDKVSSQPSTHSLNINHQPYQPHHPPFPHNQMANPNANPYKGKPYQGGRGNMQNMPMMPQGNPGGSNLEGMNLQMQHQQFMNPRGKGQMEHFQQFQPMAAKNDLNEEDYEERSLPLRKMLQPQSQQPLKPHPQMQFDQGQFAQFDNKKSFFNPPNFPQGQPQNPNMMKYGMGMNPLLPNRDNINEDKDNEEEEEEEEDEDKEKEKTKQPFMMPNQKNQPIFFKSKEDSDSDSNHK